jgi:glucose/arabinose dehydrogenase
MLLVRSHVVAAFLSPLVLLLAHDAAAQSAPPNFQVQNVFPTATFDSPDQVVFLPDGRFLVVEVSGRVWMILANGTQLPTPFLDIYLEVAGFSDLGMLGVAIDPDFATNPNRHWVYFGYTVDPNGDDVDNDPDHFVRVTRYKVSAAQSNVADLSTRQVLIGATWTTGIVTTHTSHTVGALRFAADKTLLVACGEGAHHEVPADSGGMDPGAFGPGKTDPSENIGAFRARWLNAMGGKILRIDRDTGLGISSNPFWDGNADSKRSRIYLYGFRNPFRFAIRPGTGSTNVAAGNPGVLYIGDVGMDTYEELDIATAPGKNFGWPCFEGAPVQPDYQAVAHTVTGNTNVLCSASPNPESPNPPTSPVIWWHHNNEADSSLPGWGIGSTSIGGCFYSASQYPAAYRDRYYIADLFGGWIRKIDVDSNNNVTGWSEFITNASGPVDIEADPASGDLYYIAFFPKQVRRIRYLGAVDAPEVAQAQTRLSVTSRPNPFRAGTAIEFDLPDARHASLIVYDVRGRMVRPLASGSFAAGTHAVEWDGRNDAGEHAAAGTYFYRLETERGAISGKLVSLD